MLVDLLLNIKSFPLTLTKFWKDKKTVLKFKYVEHFRMKMVKNKI